MKRAPAAAVLALAFWLGAGGMAPPAQAQPGNDSAVLAMALEPPDVDPTAGAASAMTEVVPYIVFETLTMARVTVRFIGEPAAATAAPKPSWR